MQAINVATHLTAYRTGQCELRHKERVCSSAVPVGQPQVAIACNVWGMVNAVSMLQCWRLQSPEQSAWAHGDLLGESV